MAESTPKSWFSRPEGKVGAALPVLAVAAGGAGLVYAWSSVLPWAIHFLQDTIHLGIIAAGVGTVVAVGSDARVRNLAFYGYKSVVRAATGLFIVIDPIECGYPGPGPGPGLRLSPQAAAYLKTVAFQNPPGTAPQPPRDQPLYVPCDTCGATGWVGQPSDEEHP